MDKLRMAIARNAIEKIAADGGVSAESVRQNISLAMINGLASSDEAVQRFWRSVPHEAELPTPEELILHISDIARGMAP